MTKRHSNRDFMGLKVDFSGRTETMEDVFGAEPIDPGVLYQKLWAHIKANGLSLGKTRANQKLGGKQQPIVHSVQPVDPIDDVTTYKEMAR